MYEINFPLSFLNKFCITQKKRRFHTKYTEEQTKIEEKKYFNFTQLGFYVM